MSEEEGVKLFVGQVPKHMFEQELHEMFGEIALVDEITVIKDKITRTSQGCCFVRCPSRIEADKLVGELHHKKTLSGASSPLQVKYADGELERLEHKLFIGMLPKSVSEDEVSSLFSEYGSIKDLQILRGSQQTSKGCAFVKFETKEQALAAIEALNGKHKMEDSHVPLVVKWADTEKERKQRRAQKAISQASNVPNSPGQRPLFGPLPMGYVPPYNGYGYQNPGAYGLMPYRLPRLQSQHTFPNLVPPLNQGNPIAGPSPDLSPSMAHRNYPISPSSGYLGFRYPVAFHGGMSSNQPMGNPSSSSSVSMSPSTANSPSHGGQLEGPPGANLFIYHIPQEFNDEDLAGAFRRFGRMVSAKVYVDKVTGASKCFGFVSYDSPEAAKMAINAMNGAQLGDKKLKVQLKKDNNINKQNMLG